MANSNGSFVCIISFSVLLLCRMGAVFLFYVKNLRVWKSIGKMFDVVFKCVCILLELIDIFNCFLNMFCFCVCCGCDYSFLFL